MRFRPLNKEPDLPNSPSKPRSEPSIFRKLIWRLETLAYDGVSVVLRLLPFGTASVFGGWLLRLIGPLSSKQKIAKTGIEIAFPKLTDTERTRILSDQWDNLGRTFAEFPLMHRIKAFAPHSRVTISGVENLDLYHPAIFISGHFANWEVMATVLTQSDHTVRITYRQLNNPYMDQRIISQRQKYGTKFLVQKSTHKGGRELFLALKNNESIAILNDQKFNQGLSLPFFGTQAMTATGAVRLALKTGRPLLSMSVTRKGPTFHVTINPPFKLENTGNRERDVEAGVLKILDFTERYIRANPGQWFWTHRRWPKHHYKSPK